MTSLKKLAAILIVLLMTGGPNKVLSQIVADRSLLAEISSIKARMVLRENAAKLYGSMLN
jgi:hypothetical protein